MSRCCERSKTYPTRKPPLCWRKSAMLSKWLPLVGYALACPEKVNAGLGKLKHAPQRILLAATASYAPPRGGATRSNLLWLRHLAAAGHQCRIVCGPAGEGADLPAGPNIEIFPVADPAARVRLLTTQIRSSNPD